MSYLSQEDQHTNFQRNPIGKEQVMKDRYCYCKNYLMWNKMEKESKEFCAQEQVKIFD